MQGLKNTSGASRFGGVRGIGGIVKMYIRSLKFSARNAVSSVAQSLSPIGSEKREELKKYGVLRKLAMTVCGALFGFSRIADSLYPFGMSLLCASYGEDVVFTLCGALFSSLFYEDMSLVQFVASALVFVVRRAFSKGTFKQSRKVRTAFSAAAFLFLSIVRMTIGYFSVGRLLASLAFAVVGICASYLLSALFGNEKKYLTASTYTLSVFAFCVILVLALSRFEPFGISFSLIAAGIITMSFAKTNGPMYGCVCGFLCGFACGNASMSASFGTAGLISGVLFSSSTAASSAVFVIAAQCTSLCILGYDSLKDTLPELLSSAIFFLPLSNFMTVKVKLPSEKQAGTAAVSERPFVKTEFAAVSDSLSSLSEVFFKLSEKLKKPSETETGDVIRDCFDEVCTKCSMNDMCYSKRQCNMDDAYEKISAKLHSGILDNDFLSKLLLDKCIHIPELCESINEYYSRLAYSILRSNRTQVLAGQYSAMSRLIKSTENSRKENLTPDIHLQKAVANALTRLGAEFTGVAAKGGRNKLVEVHGIRADKIPCTSYELSAYLSKECGIRLSEPSFDISDRADMVMRFDRAECISAMYAMCERSKGGKGVNGDNVSFFESNGSLFCLLSDGMGNGEQAATASRLTCVFLEKLLEAGTKKNVCLEMLNNLLLTKNDETFATVDLLEVDKLCGAAYFIKAGASPSFVLRGSKLYKICSETPPAGIISSFKAESTRFLLEKGDLILMMSDGVVQSADDALWLSELIRLDTANEPALLASEMIEKAKIINARDDDMSAAVIKIL